jgi:hypothetical protein
MSKTPEPYGRVCTAALDAHLAIAEDIIWTARKPSGLETLNPWQPLIQACQASTFLFWVAQEAVHVLLRPQIQMDNRGDLHCETGPVVRWGEDGTLYFWHGVEVPAKVILDVHALTVEQILDERNVGVQRVMIERFGTDRLIQEGRAHVQLDEDELLSELLIGANDGELELLDEVPVEVTCPNTGQKYLLELPWRPQARRDTQGRLHCETGPAVRWEEDGTGLYFWHGVEVPKQVIMFPHTLIPRQILQERNVEIRRVMIERFGAERLIRATKAEMRDQSSWGTLHVLYFDDDDSLVMVEVTCPSTGRKYLLQVPPDVETAQEAVAWTFDLRAENYQPAQQT